MRKLAMFYTIITLWEKGESERAIAHSVGCSRGKVRSAIEQYKKHGFDIPIKSATSKVESYKQQILEYLEKDLSSIRIYNGMDLPYLQNR